MQFSTSFLLAALGAAQFAVAIPAGQHYPNAGSQAQTVTVTTVTAAAQQCTAEPAVDCAQLKSHLVTVFQYYNPSPNPTTTPPTPN
ncbi:hypothetical protein HGRIS_001179 [Hohenbuehelia grisea]|uniref:Uncharacterized protein n=1 Tax=Hohenbuehelia grisea TaxID=104357 RepID=A0ABR3JPV8_9AGAR